MKVHVMTKTRRTLRRRVGLRAAEWIFLLFGLTAIDVYIWINTSAALYQAYDNWKFDRLPRADLVTPLPNTQPIAPLKLSEAKPAHPSDVLGRLEIPNLHLSVMVREGADSATLRRAVGHIPGTAFPGEIGNVGIAGHRDTFFRPLRKIRVNDPIELETENGNYRYVVESTGIVGPRDVRVLAPARSQTLTLVTCYPFYYVGSAPKRFVVHAALVSTGPERARPPGS